MQQDNDPNAAEIKDKRSAKESRCCNDPVKEAVYESMLKHLNEMKQSCKGEWAKLSPQGCK